MVPLRPPFAAITLLLLALAMGGCAAHSHIVTDAASSDAPAASTTPGFDIPTTPPVASPMAFDLLPEDTEGVSRKLSNWLSDWMSGRHLEHYELATLGFEALADNGQPDNLNRLRYYRGSGEGRLPLVLVLPIWGSFDYPSEQIAMLLRNRLQGSGHVLMLEGEQRLVHWEAMAAAESEQALAHQAALSAARLRHNVVESRRILQWARNQPEVDPDRIAIVGFSMSALVASLVSIKEPGLSGTVLVMGGAHPEQILGYCDRAAGRTRTAVFEQLQLSPERYEAVMRDAFFDLDADDYRGQVNPDSLLMVEARDDSCMPPASRAALWEAMNRPELISVRGGHQWAFLSMTPLNLNRTSIHIVDFIDQRLHNPEPNQWIAGGAGSASGHAH